MVKKRKFRWYGHISRSSGMAKTILKGTVKGARRRGRQKKRWKDNIKEWTGMGFGDSLRAAEDTEWWKGMVATSSVVPRRPRRLRDWDEMMNWISAQQTHRGQALNFIDVQLQNMYFEENVKSCSSYSLFTYPTYPNQLAPNSSQLIYSSSQCIQVNRYIISCYLFNLTFSMPSTHQTIRPFNLSSLSYLIYQAPNSPNLKAMLLQLIQLTLITQLILQLIIPTHFIRSSTQLIELSIYLSQLIRLSSLITQITQHILQLIQISLLIQHLIQIAHPTHPAIHLLM